MTLDGLTKSDIPARELYWAMPECGRFSDAFNECMSYVVLKDSAHDLLAYAREQLSKERPVLVRFTIDTYYERIG